MGKQLQNVCTVGTGRLADTTTEATQVQFGTKEANPPSKSTYLQGFVDDNFALGLGQLVQLNNIRMRCRLLFVIARRRLQQSRLDKLCIVCVLPTLGVARGQRAARCSGVNRCNRHKRSQKLRSCCNDANKHDPHGPQAAYAILPVYVDLDIYISESPLVYA